MENFEILVANVLGMYLQEKHYDKIWDILIKGERAVFKPLVSTASEHEIIEFLDFYGPENADEVIEGDLDYICRELLPLAYEKQWYKLCGFIYGMGYYASVDPLCGRRHPLVFAASQHNYAFAEAYIEGQKRFDYLTFDGECRDFDGVYRTLLEQLVLIDDADIMGLCLENGANPNAFGFSGDCLLDLARSDRMAILLRRYNAKNCTVQERNLVKAVNELRHERLKRTTMNEFFSVEPLLKLNWYYGTTTNSREQNYDIFFEAALSCHWELLEELYPYTQKGLNDEQRKAVLRAILGQHYTLPISRVLDEHPIDVARALEALARAGFRYGTTVDTAAEHPITEMFRCACWTFSLWNLIPDDVQMRVFSALWEIADSPKDKGIIQTLSKLVEEYPLTTLETFVYRIKNADEEE